MSGGTTILRARTWPPTSAIDCIFSDFDFDEEPCHDDRIHQEILCTNLAVLLPDPHLGVPNRVEKAVIKPCTYIIGAATGEAEAQVVVEWHPDPTLATVVKIVEDGN